MSRSPYDRSGAGYDRRSGDRRRDEPRRDVRRDGQGYGGPPPPKDGGNGMSLNTATIAVLAGVLIVGIGIGSAVTSTTQGDQGNIASSQQLDMAVPDPEFCRQWGASAFVMDIEMYTTLNPSSRFCHSADPAAWVCDSKRELGGAAQGRGHHLSAGEGMQTAHEHLRLHRLSS